MLVQADPPMRTGIPVWALFHLECYVSELAIPFDLHGGGIAGFERGEGGAEAFHGLDLGVVEGVDDVARRETGVDGEPIGDDGSDQDARWDA